MTENFDYEESSFRQTKNQLIQSSLPLAIINLLIDIVISYDTYVIRLQSKTNQFYVCNKEFLDHHSIFLKHENIDSIFLKDHSTEMVLYLCAYVTAHGLSSTEKSISCIFDKILVPQCKFDMWLMKKIHGQQHLLDFIKILIYLKIDSAVHTCVTANIILGFGLQPCTDLEPICECSNHPINYKPLNLV